MYEGGEVKFAMTAFVKSSDGRDQGAVWNKQDFAWLKLPKNGVIIPNIQSSSSQTCVSL